MMLPDEQKRVAWVDYAKGICIIMVVMMHSTLGTGDALGRDGLLHEVVAFAKPFRMPDFFVIAGLFLSRTIECDWRSFIDRKVVHFAYFYLLWLLIQIALKYGSLDRAGLDAFTAQFAIGLVEPLGTLWFIYLLPVFFVVTKLLRPAPSLLVWFAAALLETAQVKSGSTVVDEFASRYVFFFSGYLLSARIFVLADWARTNKALAILGLLAWSGLEAAIVFAPSPFAPYPNYATVPLVGLAAGFVGAGAVIVASVLLADVPSTGWLRYSGRNSIVIYLAFFLPMAATRIAIVQHGLISDVDVAAALVIFAGTTGPLILHSLVWNTRFRFLFERPAMFRLTRSHSTVEPQLTR